MDKVTLGYFKKCVLNRQYLDRNWVISVVCVTQGGGMTDVPYPLLKDDQGYYYLEDGEPVRLPGAADVPLMSYQDTLTIDTTWLPNVLTPVQTTVGRVIVNGTLLVDPFGDIIPYMNQRVQVKQVESIIAPLMTTDVKVPKPGVLYVKDYLRFTRALIYLSGLSLTCTVAATPKTVSPPDGLGALKAKILKDPPTNAVQVGLVEKQLKQLDDEYLKDDPGYGIMLSGKVKNSARKKLYLAFGQEKGLGTPEENPPYITNSLADGWDTSTPALAAMFNTVRSASYKRGTETQKGGTIAKVVFRAMSNFKISKGDCGTERYTHMLVTAHTVGLVVNRTIMVAGKPTLVLGSQEANKYLGKTVRLRSPLWCLSPGSTICEVCAGTNMSGGREGNVVLAMADVSKSILLASMAAMHNSSIDIVHMDNVLDRLV